MKSGRRHPPPLVEHRPPRWWGLPGMALGLVGAGVSLLSTLDHLSFKRAGGAAEGFCAIVSEAGCASAHASPSAELFEVPISLFGLAFYLAVAAVAGWATFGRHERGGRIRRSLRWAPASLLLAAVGSVFYSVYLASVLLAAGELCVFCVILYGVNLGLLGIGLRHARPVLHEPRAAAVGIAAVLALVAGIMAAVLVFGVPTYQRALARGGNAPAVASPSFAGPWPALPMHLPSRGAPTAEVTLVEFSDFECPFCARMFGTVEELARRSGPERLRVQFVNFPLDSACNPHVPRRLHPTACLAAKAAICAEQMGVFWPFAAALFKRTAPCEREDLERAARDLGLDAARFRTCMDSAGTAQLLAEQIAAAKAAGVQATPTLLVNGARVEGAIAPDRLDQLVEAARTADRAPSPAKGR